jgi:hypothetical protein
LDGLPVAGVKEYPFVNLVGIQIVPQKPGSYGKYNPPIEKHEETDGMRVDGYIAPGDELGIV